MIPLPTPTGVLYAHVFVTEGEGSIGIVLYRGDTRPVAAQSFDNATLHGLRRSVCRWIKERSPEPASLPGLWKALAESFELLEEYRHNGPDICNDWPGSRALRRLPDQDDLWTN